MIYLKLNQLIMKVWPLFYNNGSNHGNSWLLVSVLIIGGLFMIFGTKLIWYLREYKYTEEVSEPSVRYKRFMRVGGVLLLLIGIAYLVVLIVT